MAIFSIGRSWIGGPVGHALVAKLAMPWPSWLYLWLIFKGLDRGTSCCGQEKHVATDGALQWFESHQIIRYSFAFFLLSSLFRTGIVECKQIRP